VIIRPAQKGLVLHTMYFANEVRNFGEIGKGESAKITGAETKLATRLIDELSNDVFEPEKYEDEYSQRVLNLVKEKAEGKEISVSQTPPQRGNVIDIMEALKKSLGSVSKERKPAVRAKASEPEKARKKALSAKK
jgi:DNA end-binding protein Ku